MSVTGDHFQVLHVRITSPPDVTGRLLENLTADSGVLNLVVLKGAARQPDGDAVQFDLRPSSANRVFGQLRDLRRAGLCSVMVETVDASLAEPQQAPAYESWSRALGSTWQLLLNVGLLIVVGAAALGAQRWIWRAPRDHQSWRPPQARADD